MKTQRFKSTAILTTGLILTTIVSIALYGTIALSIPPGGGITDRWPLYVAERTFPSADSFAVAMWPGPLAFAIMAAPFAVSAVIALLGFRRFTFADSESGRAA